MPIEFRCPECDRLLRVPDETAGRQARCPQCGTVMAIPEPGAGQATVEAGQHEQGEAGAASSEQSSSPNSPRAALQPGWPGTNPYVSAHRAEANPYQAAAALPYAVPADVPSRSGPSWERDGFSAASFVRTAVEAYTNVVRFFASMRRKGGIGAPLAFAMISGTGSFLVMFGLQLVMQSALEALGVPIMNPGVDPLQMFCCCSALWPFFLLVYLFSCAAAFHLMLLLMGAFDISLETTFRVVAYGAGTSFLLLLVPVCGQYVFPIVQLVFTGIGLCYAHETSGGKAAGAVLIPCLLSCGFGVALLIAFGSMIMKAIEQGA